MGPPASGKSSFCENHLVPHGYVRVNRDTLGTAAKCMKVSKIGKIMSCFSGLEIRLFSSPGSRIASSKATRQCIETITILGSLQIFEGAAG